jgi:hypothetical protein
MTNADIYGPNETRARYTSRSALNVEPGSQFGWLPSGKSHSDGFETLAQPAVSGIGGMAWMPIHRFVDVREIERRLH